MPTASSMNASETPQWTVEQHNSSQQINQLPLEILSHIFLLGHELDLLSKSSDAQTKPFVLEERGPYFEEQVVVCRHWRRIALDMPLLWSHIGLEGSRPLHRIKLFLARTKHNTLLDLDLDMKGLFMFDIIDNPEAQAERAVHILKYIIGCGGGIHRWMSLKVWTNIPRVILSIVEFLSGATLNNLSSLELSADFYDLDHHITQILTDDALEDQDLSQAVIFREPPPHLTKISLRGFPTPFIFAHPSKSLLSGLTHLDLSTTYILPPLRSLYNLFVSNPALESLMMDMSGASVALTSLHPLEDCVADLSHLRYLTLTSPCQTYWLIAVLSMMDAPRVESLSLDFQHALNSSPPGIVALYLSRGRRDGKLSNPAFRGSGKRGPIYPALQCLSIRSFPDQGHYLSVLLQSLPMLTRLDWELGESCDKAILGLIDRPLPCPKLRDLRTHGVPNDELLELVRTRIRHGVPLKTLEVNSRDWDRIKGSTKRYLKGALERFGQYWTNNWDEQTDSESDGYL